MKTLLLLLLCGTLYAHNPKKILKVPVGESLRHYAVGLPKGVQVYTYRIKGYVCFVAAVAGTLGASDVSISCLPEVLK